MACLLGARAAFAGASCVTRSNCRPLAKQYVARAHVSCFVVVPVPMCINRGSSCGTVTANCDWYACLTGGGRARATNGPAGCVTSFDRWGLGLAGDASFDPAYDPTLLMSEDDGGDGETLTNARFDEAARTVEVRLESGRLTATPGGLGQRLTAWIFRDESEGDDEDPMPTAKTTLWTGSVTLIGGELTVTGFDPAAFALSTNDEGHTVVTFTDVATVVPLEDLSKEDFASVAVKILTDEVAP
jgi:hypothetical protein